MKGMEKGREERREGKRDEGRDERGDREREEEREGEAGEWLYIQLANMMLTSHTPSPVHTHPHSY